MTALNKKALNISNKRLCMHHTSNVFNMMYLMFNITGDVKMAIMTTGSLLLHSNMTEWDHYISLLVRCASNFLRMNHDKLCMI